MTSTSRQIAGLRIEGITAAVPESREDNMAYALLSEKEKKLLVKTTGIRYRRIARPGMATSDLCFAAAQRLMNGLDWQPEDVDILVFVSQSPDYYLPATAITMQDRLGLSQRCMAFDVGLGCSGYVYGLSIIGSMMRAMGLRRGLLLAGDVSSLTAASTDKSTYPLFGDAGTATALSYDPDEREVWTFNLASDGSGSEAIIIPHGGARHQIDAVASFDVQEVGAGIARRPLDLALDGLAVFNFSIGQVPDQMKDILASSDTRPEALDLFVMHQANKLMNETIRKKLGFLPEQTPYSLFDFGNTSSASIPLTLVHVCGERLAHERLDMLLSGFGVGLSWGSVVLSTSPMFTAPVIEVS